MRGPFDYLVQLKQNYPPDYLDAIQYELDAKVYYYGSHFLKTRELVPSRSIYLNARSRLIDFYKLGRDITPGISKGEKYAICGAYFGLEKHLNKSDIKTLPMPWLAIKASNWSQFRILRKYQQFLSNSTFSELLNDKAILRYKEVVKTLFDIYNQSEVRFLCVPQDMSPFERISIKIFKELNKPSFVFLHGLPGRYNNIDDNRSDYLVVWGNKIKDQYIKAGIDAKKIFVSGHPRYDKYNLKKLTSKEPIKNILVLGKSVGGQHSDAIRFPDRGSILSYLWQIQSVLKSVGINSAKLRPHPSMSIKWYYDFIDKNFFKPDLEADIGIALKNADLVIGPTSSVFIESLLNNVNYLVFEPLGHGLDMEGFPLVAPFDKSDSRIVVANTEDQLKAAIESKALVDLSFMTDYVAPEFDLTFMDNLIK